MATRKSGALIIQAVRLYQRHGSRFFSGSCLYTPSCSRYAIDAVTVRGPVTGMLLALSRLLRCRAPYPGGHDPIVPSPAVVPSDPEARLRRMGLGRSDRGAATGQAPHCAGAGRPLGAHLGNSVERDIGTIEIEPSTVLPDVIASRSARSRQPGRSRMRGKRGRERWRRPPFRQRAKVLAGSTYLN